jgi:hypothetical protein
MSLFILMGLANPMTWLILAMLAIAWRRFRHRRETRSQSTPNKEGAHTARVGATSAVELGAAFQFLSIAYRPNHAFTAKAQIQQMEKADDDDDGDPDTPIKHLHRQLRRIRQGEPVDRLIWRLE